MRLREYINALLKKDEGFATDYIVVANTYMNLSFKRLTQKLSLFNAMLNKKLFRYFQKYPEKRIQFAYNNQQSGNNTHSHIIIKLPDEYKKSEIDYLKIFELMRFKWWQLDIRKNKKFRLYFQKVDDEANSKFCNVNYAVRENKKDTAQNTEFQYGIL